MKPENVEMVKKLIEGLLAKMTFSGFTVDIREESNLGEGNIVFNINSRESDLLIGQHGANLRAFQHIIRAMARKKTEEKLKFSVDINDYHKDKIGTLENLARSLAQQAINDKRPVVMRPMTAYERRVVHLILSENSQVKTESIGEGEERKVVIRPVGNIESKII
jgi:spoIIIJ-associated protein